MTFHSKWFQFSTHHCIPSGILLIRLGGKGPQNKIFLYLSFLTQ